MRWWSGEWEVTITIDGREYTYSLTSERDKERVEWLLRSGWGGKGVAYLKKFGRLIKK
jgi:hypothetical protein